MRESRLEKQREADGTLKIAINPPLIFAAIGVLLAAVAERIVPLYKDTIFLSLIVPYLTTGLFILACGYLLFEIIRQGSRAFKSRREAVGIYSSALLASVLMGLAGLVIMDGSREGLRLAGLGIGIGLLALILLFLLNVEPERENSEVEETVRNGQRQNSGQKMQESTIFGGPLKVGGSSAYRMNEAVTIRQAPAPIPAVSLPPLFEKDPLYTLPRPKGMGFYAVVKGNDTPLASEDACVISPDENRIALCDGASGSSLARPWATLLGLQWIKEPLYQIDSDTLSHWLREPQQQWDRWVREVWQPSIDQRNEVLRIKPTSDYVLKRTLETGAAATFLGLEINRLVGKWRVTALGDTCIFVVRPGKNPPGMRLKKSLPLTTAAQFGERPPLLSSNMYGITETFLGNFHQLEEPYQRGEILLLATDALAQWILEQREQGQTEWQKLLTLADQESFSQLIEEQRNKKQMVDDDTTLVVIPL